MAKVCIYDMVAESAAEPPAPGTPSETCQHLRTTKLGTNGVVRIVTCMDCEQEILRERK